MATAMARNGSRGSPISPPKGLNTISASSAASSVRYSANRYSSRRSASSAESGRVGVRVKDDPGGGVGSSIGGGRRSEEHTSELQSLMRISYAVFCLKKKKKTTTHLNHMHT